MSTAFVQFIIKNIIYGINKKDDKKPDKGHVWASALDTCSKKDAYRRGIRNKWIKPIDDLEFLQEWNASFLPKIGSFVENQTAEWLTDPEWKIRRNVEVKWGELSGKIDILFEAEAQSIPIEVKYQKSAVGPRLSYFLQLASYVVFGGYEYGLLEVVDLNGNPHFYHMVNKGETLPVFKWEIDEETGDEYYSPFSPYGYEDLPRSVDGQVEITRELVLSRLEAHRSALLAVRSLSPKEYKNMPGDWAGLSTNVHWECGKIVPAEFYKINTANNKKGDLKLGTGTVEKRCPFFDLCFPGWQIENGL